MINFRMSGSASPINASFRGASGLGYYNALASTNEKRIRAQKKRFIKRAAFYARSVSRNLMKRGRTPKRYQDVRYWDHNLQQFETGTRLKSYRSRSTPPASPLAHARGGSGLKFIWAQPYRMSIDPDAYIVAPVKFKSKGSVFVNFPIHAKLATGGGGKMLAPRNENDSMSRAQLFQRGMKKATWSWTPVRYKPRPYMTNAIEPTRDKFPMLWYNAKG